MEGLWRVDNVPSIGIKPTPSLRSQSYLWMGGGFLLINTLLEQNIAI